MNPEIQGLVNKLDLLPHPEGGFYKETYRSSFSVLKSDDPNLQAERQLSTCIYFLITSEAFSAFHRIKQDEIWHFYAGTAIHLHMIHPDGKYEMVKIGNNFEAGEVPQAVVPATTWFASEVPKSDSYALAGCTVAPGFDFQDFELATEEKLSAKYPEHQKVIQKLTRI